MPLRGKPTGPLPVAAHRRRRTCRLRAPLQRAERLTIVVWTTLLRCPVFGFRPRGDQCSAPCLRVGRLSGDSVAAIPRGGTDRKLRTRNLSDARLSRSNRLSEAYASLIASTHPFRWRRSSSMETLIVIDGQAPDPIYYDSFEEAFLNTARDISCAAGAKVADRFMRQMKRDNAG
jgi:hypothetical protein